MSEDRWQLAKSNLVTKIVMRLRAQESVLESLLKVSPSDTLRGALAATKAAIIEAERCGW